MAVLAKSFDKSYEIDGDILEPRNFQILNSKIRRPV